MVMSISVALSSERSQRVKELAAEGRVAFFGSRVSNTDGGEFRYQMAHKRRRRESKRADEGQRTTHQNRRRSQS